MRRINKKGQMGMSLITGMFVAVFVFVMLSAFLPVIVQMIGFGKGSDSANCVETLPGNICSSNGGIEPCYNSSLSTDTITCSILSFTPGMLVMAIVFAVISGIISGKLALSSQEQQPAYQYQQY